MYWRYFMWNFAGRQNDIQGNGELEHGNCITGIPFIDNARLGDQSKLPKDLQAYDPVTNPGGNKGHNAFYCLPLILGLIGLFWQAFRGRRGIRQFWVVFFLFFMTGLAIVVYLNQTPVQPRERDYAYAGSFYAFAIWCGMGVAALYELLGQRLKVNRVALAAVIGVLCLLVPLRDGFADMGRPRPLGQIHLSRFRKQLPHVAARQGQPNSLHQWRQRHLPSLVQPGDRGRED